MVPLELYRLQLYPISFVLTRLSTLGCLHLYLFSLFAEKPYTLGPALYKFEDSNRGGYILIIAPNIGLPVRNELPIILQYKGFHQY